jgi:hypothetical protein
MTPCTSCCQSASSLEWRFHDGGRQVVFFAGPLTGQANAFLYDAEKQQVIDQCIRRDPGAVCADWAK